ncbi:MAG: aminoacetone oxidase family FAD-binding enzyme [Clostridia bacterium]|nr:aminoacetone oxidase family FAD-binding enzyme [Clostridia bacterium]
MSKQVAIIGAGSSGLLAATAIRNKKITLFEKNDRVGKKLFATGNGRCNLLNESFGASGLFSKDDDIVKTVLGDNSFSEISEYFKNLGLFTFTDNEGRIYPLSNQSSSVLDILRFSARKNGADIITDTEVLEINKTENGFEIITENGKSFSDIVIFSTGGMASAKTNGYDILKKLGHTIIPPSPVLVQLKADTAFTAPLKGIRSKVKISLYEKDTLLREESGEIQFTDYGLSGIASMQLSRFITENCYVLIDFADGFSEEEIYRSLKNSLHNSNDISDIFAGILKRRVAEEIIKKTLHISPRAKSVNLSDEEIRKLSKEIKALKLDIKGTLGFDSAQVTRGGVSLSEINPETMESKIHKGLYITGEVLDCDGECGGYNLGWAWLTALRASNGVNNA